jgi:hypothetical protein
MSVKRLKEKGIFRAIKKHPQLQVRVVDAL